MIKYWTQWSQILRAYNTNYKGGGDELSPFVYGKNLTLFDFDDRCCGDITYYCLTFKFIYICVILS